MQCKNLMRMEEHQFCDILSSEIKNIHVLFIIPNIDIIYQLNV